jgi:hypothetical protein
MYKLNIESIIFYYTWVNVVRLSILTTIVFKWPISFKPIIMDLLNTNLNNYLFKY